MKCASWTLLAGVFLVYALAANAVRAQEPPGEEVTPVLATFDEARALAVDPRGRLYVADAGRDVVVVLGPKGERQHVIGGPGTRTGEFDGPAAVEPTNGQLILIADTYNGRVQRFSGEGRYLESLPIGPSPVTGTEGWIVNDGQDGAAVRGEGRPIAVSQRNDGTVYVIDERGGVVRKWTELGRLRQIAGGGQRLEEPVALASGPDGHLYVADAAAQAVFVFDSFGTFIRRLPAPPLSHLRALTMHQGRLWIICAQRFFVWRGPGTTLKRQATSLEEPLVDAVPRGNALYLLTATRLVRRSR